MLQYQKFFFLRTKQGLWQKAEYQGTPTTKQPYEEKNSPQKK